MHNADLNTVKREKKPNTATRLMLVALLTHNCRQSTTTAPEIVAIKSSRSIRFAGRDWQIKSGQMGPGNNHWNPDNVFIDSAGLHLRITHDGARWTCSEVSLASSLGYGCYTFEVEGSSQNGINEIVGLFLYQDDDHEYDVELGRFGSIRHPGAQYVIQPINDSTVHLNRHQFSLHDPVTEVITHRISVGQTAVSFSSYNRARSNPRLQHWTATPNAPVSAQATVHLNYWLFDHLPPTDGQEHEIIIKNFTFTNSCRN